MNDGAADTGAGTTETTDEPLAFATAVAEPAIPPVEAIDYAGPQTFDLAPLLPALRLMVPLAVLSGLCVATCWFCLWGVSGRFLETAALVHVVVYVATLSIAAMAGKRLEQAAGVLTALRAPRRRVLDLIAGVGLAVIGLFPPLLLAYNPVFNRNRTLEALGPPLLGVAFALLMLTVYRHRLLYTPLSRVMRSAGRISVARLLSTVGWIKFIYEGVWLFCCATPLLAVSTRFVRDGDAIIYLAFGAAGGCVGFIAVWIMMIVAHVKALNAARQSLGGYR